MTPRSPLSARNARRPSTLIRRSLAGLAAAAAIGAGSAALAQPAQPGSNELRPPIPSPPTNPPSNPISIAVAIGLLLLIVGANAIPSKRGHQD